MAEPQQEIKQEEEENMNMAERLSLILGVLIVEKYEYTMDGLAYGSNMILSMCGYGEEDGPYEEQNDDQWDPLTNTKWPVIMQSFKC